MIWLALALVFLSVWGGLQAVRPSPTQRRLAALRQAAMQRGLRLTLGSQLRLETGYDLHDLVAYRRLRARPVSGCYGWLVCGEDGELMASQGCFAEGRGLPQGFLASLPPGCRLVGATAGDVFIGWDERGDESQVSLLAERLNQLEAWTAPGAAR